MKKVEGNEEHAEMLTLGLKERQKSLYAERFEQTKYCSERSKVLPSTHV